ncbi:MAG: cation diffusion facilitator family transporter [Minisyncoccales bacterium]
MKEKIAIYSFLVNFILTAGKLFVGFIAGSASVIAEGMHSAMDVVSAVIIYFGIKISGKPGDEKHPYGHQKFEVLSGILVTLLLFISGLWVLYEAYQGFFDPELISISYLALGVMGFSAVSNEIMARFKIYYGKKENSMSLLSDGVHDRVDVYTSIAVVIGLLIMPYWIYTDAVLAALIGLYILKESFELGKEASDSLLDSKAEDETEEKIKEIVEKNKIELNDLKTQKRGSVVSANLEIKLPKEKSVEEAEKISENLRKELLEKIDVLNYVAIQIKSLDIIHSYYKPESVFSVGPFRGRGKGYGWQRKGREGGKALGPGGYCICENCNYKEEHKPGVPCYKTKCPKCGGMMKRLENE